MSASACPRVPAPRLALHPRPFLLARLEELLARAGSRLDRVDPPSVLAQEPQPVLALRLLGTSGDVPRADA